MLKLYEDLYIKYFLTGLIGGIFIFILSCFLTGSVIIAFIFFIIFVYLIAIYFNKKANKRVEEIKKYYYDCDVETYTNSYENLYKKSENNKKIETFIRIGLSTGYMSLGKYKDALDLLSSFNPIFRNNKFDIMCKAAYLNNQIVIYRDLEQYEESNMKLIELKEMMNNSKLNNELTNYIEKLYMSNKITLDIYENPTKENLKHAEKLFKEKLKEAKLKVEIVNLNYRLAYISKELKNKKAELDYLKFVIENGGSLYIVKKAKKRIKELSE